MTREKAYRRPVKHIESGKIFPSIVAAAKYFNIPIERVNGRCIFLPELTFEKIEDGSILRIYVDPKEPEEYKSIPGYEGLYSMSNKGRIRCDQFEDRHKTYTTNKEGQHVVILSKNSSPHMYTVESLFDMTWNNTEPRVLVNKPIRKSIRCIDDSRMFASRIECCRFYNIDYSKMMKAIKAACGDNFECNGHIFAVC